MEINCAYAVLLRFYGEKTAEDYQERRSRGVSLIETATGALTRPENAGEDLLRSLDDTFPGSLNRDAVNFDPARINPASSLR